jgi:PAS domain S-box-containing protein
MFRDALSKHIAADRERIANFQRLRCVDQELLVRTVKELTDSLEEALTIQEHVRAVTEQKASEYDKTTDERQRYFQFFDKAPHAYIVTSLTGVIVEANEACRILLNFEKNFLIGLPLRVFVANEERCAFDECVKVPVEERAAGKYSFHFLPHNKPVFTAALTVYPYGDEPQLGWTLEDHGDPQIQGSRVPSAEKQCFDDWILGKEVRWIGESEGVSPTQVLEWVTEWERGIQQKWHPYIPGLE